MSVKGLTITGNTIELSTKYPTGSKLPSVDLDYCEDVIFKNNTYTGFTWPITLKKLDNCTNVEVKSNKGLSN